MKIWIAFLLFLLPIVHCGQCPDGYHQSPDGGDCYYIFNYYVDWIQTWTPEAYDDVQIDCNGHNGGLLASIHSQEEEDNIWAVAATSSRCAFEIVAIGLRCVGKVCKWPDGSPVTYTNFDEYSEPADDGETRCYAVLNKWKQESCETKLERVCWLCSFRAKTIECAAGETEYKGGCVSVHTNPLDQKTADASCPGGGHLVSMHSKYERSFYTDLAIKAGATGTIYIGGQYSNGKFEWIDGSIENSFNWANGFPNTIFGTCVQMLLSPEFGVQGQWTNVDCGTKQSYICIRFGDNYGPTLIPPPPKADPHCPPSQMYTGSGSIYSPNYPISIPGQQSCQYILGTAEGTLASVKFPVFNCQSGTTLSLIDGLNNNQPFITFTTNSPALNQSYTAKSNVMKIVFSATTTPVGTGWEAEFTGV